MSKCPTIKLHSSPFISKSGFFIIAIEKNEFRKMAAKMHPDRNRGDPDATDNFQKLAWCHDMFQSKEKREQYHRCGEHCVNKGDSNQNRFTSIRMETMTHRYASSVP